MMSIEVEWSLRTSIGLSLSLGRCSVKPKGVLNLGLSLGLRCLRVKPKSKDDPRVKSKDVPGLCLRVKSLGLSLNLKTSLGLTLRTSLGLNLRKSYKRVKPKHKDIIQINPKSIVCLNLSIF